MLTSTLNFIYTENFDEAFIEFEHAIEFSEMPMHSGLISQLSLDALVECADLLIEKMIEKGKNLKKKSLKIVDDKREMEILEEQERTRKIIQTKFDKMLLEYEKLINEDDLLGAREVLIKTLDITENPKYEELLSIESLSYRIILSERFLKKWNKDYSGGAGFIIEDEPTLSTDRNYFTPDDEGYVYIKGYRTEDNYYYGGYFKIGITKKNDDGEDIDGEEDEYDLYYENFEDDDDLDIVDTESDNGDFDND